MEKSSTTTASRRSFLKKGAAVGSMVAASTLAAPAVLGQAPIVMKMQTSWPASDIWMDFARQYVERVEGMSGGRLKVDLLPAGAVVAAFQVIDACNDGVIDAAHSVPVYWYGKCPRRSGGSAGSRSSACSGPGSFRWSSSSR